MIKATYLVNERPSCAYLQEVDIGCDAVTRSVYAHVGGFVHFVIQASRYRL